MAESSTKLGYNTMLDHMDLNNRPS